MTTPKPGSGFSLRARRQSHGWLALCAVLLLGCVFHADGAFFSAQTHQQLFGAAGVSGLLACGMTVVILTGGIDLSVGSLLGLSGMVFALGTLSGDWPWPVAVSLAVAVGVCAGLINGGLVAWLSLQPFVATLAMMVIARGAAKFAPMLAGLQSGQKVQPVTGLGPPFFDWLDGVLPLPMIRELGLPVIGIVWLASVALLWFALRRTVFGRHVFAIGGNEAAARLVGIPVARVKLLAYATCGGLCAVASVCHVARTRLGDPEAGLTYELKAIAAVVVGGTALAGGRGGVLQTLIGVLIIEYIEKILSINAVELAARLMIQGLIIVCAVAINRRTD